MTSSENVNLPLLTCGADGASNYKDWASAVFRFYQSKRVEGIRLSHIIEGKGKRLPPPALGSHATAAEKLSYEAELEQWEKADATAFTAINKTIPASLLLAIRDCVDAKEAWEALKQRFDAHTSTSMLCC